MDFDARLAPHLQGFRDQVRSWLRDRVSGGVPRAGGADGTAAVERARQLQRQLASQGWAAPSWPREAGGGGLTPGHDAVVREEMDSLGLPDLFRATRQVASAIMSWGTREQQAAFVPALLRGDASAWRPISDSELVADPTSFSVTAEKDGDFYVLSGEETFFGGLEGPSYLWTLASTSDMGPSHRRLSALLVPAELPGVDTSWQETLGGAVRRAVRFQEARVPASHRIGEEGDGWLAAQSALEDDGEGERAAREQQALAARLVAYCKTTLRGRQPLIAYHRVRQRAAEAYIAAQVVRLLALRNRWLRERGQHITYQAAQYSLMVKRARLRMASTALDVMGPFALLSDREWAPLDGEAEAHQRASIPGATDGDGIGVQERLMGSRLGLHPIEEDDADSLARTYTGSRE